MTGRDKEKYDSIVADVKDEKKAFDLWLKWKALTDLYFLGSEIMGWRNSKDKSGKKRRVDPTFHRWLAGKLQCEEDTLILAPRFHLKTTWSKLRIIQIILNNPNTRVLMASIGSRLAEKELADIKGMLTNPLLMRLFPEIIPKPGKDFRNWEKCTANELTMRRDRERGFVPQEPQITAVGMGGRITGLHFDWAFIDDILDDSTVTTPEQMEKTEAWWAYLQPILESDAVTIMTGTRYHQSDLYGKIIQEKQFRKIFTRAAIENGKIIYKSWMTMKALDKMRKRMGEYKFSCQMLNNPMPMDERIFVAPFPQFSELQEGKYTYYMTVDPAATTKKWSDESAIAICALNERNALFIVECTGYKVPGNKLAEIIIQKVLQYKPMRVGIEFGLQEHLRHIIEFKVQEYERVHPGINLGVLNNILPIKISRQHSKAQRIRSSLGAFVAERKCLIHTSCTKLMRQMEFFTGQGKEHDDLVDAASMLFSVIDKFAQHYWIEPMFRKGLTLETFFEKKPKGWEDRFVS